MEITVRKAEMRVIPRLTELLSEVLELHAKAEEGSISMKAIKKGTRNILITVNLFGRFIFSSAVLPLFLFMLIFYHLRGNISSDLCEILPLFILRGFPSAFL